MKCISYLKATGQVPAEEKNSSETEAWSYFDNS